MLKSIGLSSESASSRTAGKACFTSISPVAYHPLSTAETNQQLSCVGVGSAEQSMSPGFRMTSPVFVSYHWYRKPS
jgi:hypothetical protein